MFEGTISLVAAQMQYYILPLETNLFSFSTLSINVQLSSMGNSIMQVWEIYCLLKGTGFTWARQTKNMPSNLRKMRRFRSSWACAKYHPGRFSSPFIHSTISNDSFSGHRWPWSDCADAQADLGHRCPLISEDTFSPGASHDKFSSSLQKRQR